MISDGERAHDEPRRSGREFLSQPAGRHRRRARARRRQQVPPGRLGAPGRRRRPHRACSPTARSSRRRASTSPTCTASCGPRWRRRCRATGCASARPACRWCCTRATRACRRCTPTFATCTRGSAPGSAAATDLTPYYVVPEDAVHFHRTLRDVCVAVRRRLLPALQAMVRRLLLPAPPRGAARRRRHLLRLSGSRRRGDRAAAAGPALAAPAPVEADRERLFAFVRALGAAILPAYLPIVDAAATSPGASASAAGSSCAAAATSSST